MHNSKINLMSFSKDVINKYFSFKMSFSFKWSTQERKKMELSITDWIVFLFGREKGCSGGSRGRSGGSNEPPLGPKLFHFHGEFREKLVKLHKSNPPQPPTPPTPWSNLNPRSKNPGSAPGASYRSKQLPSSEIKRKNYKEKINQT